MVKQYQTLNKKLDALTNKTNQKQSKIQKEIKAEQQQRITNMTNIKLTKEQTKLLSLGPIYAIEQEPKLYINELTVETENAIRRLEPKTQNTHRHLATKQIKWISRTNRQNLLHKRQQYNMNCIKKTLQNNEVSIARADKSKATVIIKTEDLNRKVDKFIKDNNIKQTKKDPTEKYQVIIQHTLKNNNLIVEKQQYKYLMNIKHTAPKLNVYIKTHKENEPIRPVINKTQAPPYKIAKYINKKMHHLLSLPNNYNTKNSYEIAEELNEIKINENSRIITLDIKDLYVNLPLNRNMHATKYWLNKNNNSKDIIKQLLNIIKTVIQQNYFQYKNIFYQTVKGIAMGSPLSGTIAGLYLQYVEETYIKQRWDTNGIMYYKTYVDDILIIYNNQKIKIIQ